MIKFKQIILITFSLFTLFIATGCSPITPKYTVTIDAITISNASLSPESYTLQAKDSKSNDLRSKRYLPYLDTILQEQGYSKASNGSLAKQTIYLDYGIEKGDEATETYMEPNIHIGFGYNSGFNHPFGGYFGNYNHPFFNNYYDAGYRTYQRTYIMYNRYVHIVAKDQASKELWRVDVTSEGQSKNLRKIIPLLIQSAKPFLGTTTALPVELVVEGAKSKKE